MDKIKIFAINLGSTSTKVAYYEDDECLFKDNIVHSHEEIYSARTIFDQYGFRKRDIENFMKKHEINIDELDCIVSRGGPTQPIDGGTYIIEQEMLDEIRSGEYGIHPCSLGCQIAFDLVEGTNAKPLTVDMPGTCEFTPLAFYSGMPGLSRYPAYQALNNRAMASYYAEQVGKKYEDMNLLVCTLGGGVTVTAHRKGKMIDAQNGITGDGAFCNNRCNAVPVGPLVDMCYSGKYTHEEMRYKINGGAGLMGYLGTIDTRAIEKEANEGNFVCREVLEAMCYQISKDIGAYATVLNGDVDAIILIGGMAHSEMITGFIKERVSFIAPVVIMPGEREMESLCINSYRALKGEIPIKHFEEGKIDD